MTYLLLVLSICATSFCVIYFTHMFQLSGYHKDAHIKWFYNNLGSICARYSFTFLALLVCLFNNVFSLVVASVLFVLTIITFLPRQAKKPLVYTSRIKRLLLTVGLIYAAVYVVNFIFFNNTLTVFPLCVIFSNFAVLCADILNSPLEKAVKKKFINEAKNILSERKNLKVIGITGSYGKTSTKYFLTKILNSKYNVLMTPQSYNTPMGVVKTVREMLKPSHEIFVCEMGAKYKGDIKELCDIVKPDMGIITSVGPQHLESFKSIENVVNTKFELCDSLSEDSTIYLNYDNELIRRKEVKCKTKSYGIESIVCDLKGEILKVSESGTDFKVTYNGETYEFSTKLLGSHNVQNICGCIAVAIDLGVEIRDIQIAVRRLESVPHRLQLINAGNVTIIDDAFNANPQGTKAALEVLSGFDGVKIIVTPGMIELGDEQTRLNMQFGKACAKVCDYVFLVGGKIANDVYDGAASTNINADRLVRFNTVQQAVDAARNLSTGEKRKYILLENDLPDNY